MSTDITSINENPLAHFDALCCRSAPNIGSVQRRDETLLCLLSIAGYPSSTLDNLTESLIDALDQGNGVERRETLVACLVIAVAKLDDEWMKGRLLRPKVMTMIDSVLSGDIYASIQMDADKQTHEKIPQLRTAVLRYEDQLRSAAAELTSIERVQAHRGEMLKALKHRLGQLILKPFLPPNCVQEMSEVYTRVERYIQNRRSLDAISTYENAFNTLQHFAEALAQQQTHYSDILLGVVQRLIDIIRDDFSQDEAAQPGLLVVTRNSKKYAFSQVGQTLDLVFTITNTGLGYAHDVRLVTLAENSVSPLPELPLGRIPPQSTQTVQIPTAISEPTDRIIVQVSAEWRNYGSDEELSNGEIFEIEAQRADIDWAALERIAPYSLDPVTNPHNLVGRSSDINNLIAVAQAPDKPGSAYITGQKRVGKTSIAKALGSILREHEFIVVDLPGDYTQSNAEKTIKSLGAKICRAIKREVPDIRELPIPTFDQDLSPLGDYLEEVTDQSQARIVIILDEFDEIPPTLYTPSDMATAFFMSLRSISSQPAVGFILVGGEKMATIFQSQGMHLNKWKQIPVDYFDFNSDYRELVRRPVEGTLEYSEEALRRIYQVTAGNPFFTKQLCGYIFSEAIRRRDCYVTEFEVDEAIAVTVSKVAANAFQHFWDDGIDKRSENEEEKRERRRRILVALHDTLTISDYATNDDLLKHGLLAIFNPMIVAGELNEFVRRKVLVSDSPGTYRFKVELFHAWLKARGTHDLLAGFGEQDVALRERIQEEDLRIRPEEITDLLTKWDTRVYKGMPLTTDAVRAWLNQFPAIREQRAMFTILSGLHFYTEAAIRQKLIDGHRTRVTPGLVYEVAKRQRTRDDIMVSTLIGAGKSSAVFAKLYATEANIKLENVVERGKLRERLNKSTGINALVFADDFVGTGNQISQELRGLDERISQIVSEKQIRVVIVLVAATTEGLRQLDELRNQLQMHVEVYVGDILADEDFCFNPASRFFASDADREYARQIARKYGEILWPDNPLGYGEQGLAVVFEHTCPNNSLPILWSEGTGDQRWRPLFER